MSQTSAGSDGRSASGIGAALALAAAEAAHAKAAEIGMGASVSVADMYGREVLTLRGDTTIWLTVGVARAKARTSSSTGIDTEHLKGLKANYPEVFEQWDAQLPFAATTLGGGLAIRLADGTLLGAIGVSGGTEEQDSECAQAGVAAVLAALNS